MKALRNQLQEFREMGVRGVAYRSWWEIKTRSGLAARLERSAGEERANLDLALRGSWGCEWPRKLPWETPCGVVDSLLPHISAGALSRLLADAEHSVAGKVVCFSRWVADYGCPIDWHKNPGTGNHWDPGLHWSEVMRDAPLVGDVKLTWEIGRFPQAYLMARAAAFCPANAPRLATALSEQLLYFQEQNPAGFGVHWSSGQEVAIRLVALLFAFHVFEKLGLAGRELQAALGRAIYQSGAHLFRNLEYAREFVFNNHLIWEALGLYLAGALLKGAPGTSGWTETGKSLLEEQAERQVYPDGGYIQQSHNYHRMAMQAYLVACAFQDGPGDPPEVWRKAMERSLDFLAAHQNPEDGRLPNYGANDGALPCVLSTCDYSDFRPTLQALSIASRGERVFDPGPWDEEAAWLFGIKGLELSQRKIDRRSVSFAYSGHHVLRGQAESTFACFRCGDLRNRFSQIDMLHVDVWWRGHNVLVDGGSYLYNGPQEWHNHFHRTESHNTVQIDTRDQMLHYRRFKCLYWTKAKLLRFEDHDDWGLCEGEHYGYQRHPGRCIHRRSVIFVKDDLWVVVDQLLGSGTHLVRLHWLCGDFPCRLGENLSQITLATPSGPFSVTVLAETGEPLPGTLAAGQETPPRGWLSRYYGEKTPVPSFAVECERALPVALVTVLCSGKPEASVAEGLWSIRNEGCRARFRIGEDWIQVIEAGPGAGFAAEIRS